MSNSKEKDTYVKRKKDINLQSVDSMQAVVNVVDEASEALNDKIRTIKASAIPEVLAGALGAGIRGAGSFAALYGLGVAGLSAAGITSGLAAAGMLGTAVDILLVGIPKKAPGGLKGGTLANYVRDWFDRKFPEEEMEKLASSKVNMTRRITEIPTYTSRGCLRIIIDCFREVCLSTAQIGFSGEAKSS